MKVNSNRDISFKGFYNNKALKKSLEFAADYGAMFAATTTLALSTFARPAAIMLAPHTDKENKKFACAKSLASSVAQFILTFIIATPMGNAIKNIDKNPNKFLKPETINNLQKTSKNLVESKNYEFATQLFKLGSGLIVSIPKAILTAACMPFILQKIFHKPKRSKNKENSETNNINFKSKGSEKLSKGIGKILDKKWLQNFSEKYKDSNFVMHIVALTDALTTGTFIHEVYRSENIEERRKKAVMYNAGISTALSIGTGYLADKLMDKPTEKFIEKFKNANKGQPNLEKQLLGIKVAKPILIVGSVYYMIIPFISTILADIADHDPRFDLPHKKHKNLNKKI